MVGGENAPFIDAMPCVAASREMINERRPVYDPRLFALHQVREVVVLFEMSGHLGNDGGKRLSQRAVIDALDFPREIDLAVPDFQRRQFGENAHAAAVCFD